MAVPIVLEGQVVGVLDVQENEINSLDESDASLLRSLANQVAVAIHNARLFNEVETALAEARVVQEQYVEQAWNKMKRIEKGGEHLHMRNPAAAPLPETAMAEAKQLALAHHNPTVVTINADNLDVVLQNQNLDGVVPPELSKQIKSIVAPVILGGNTIGALQMHRFDADDGSEPLPWTDEDLAIVEAVLDQVAQSAENLRLFEETRQHAGREQTIRQITENMRVATNLEELVEIAAKELGQHFSAEYAMVELGVNSSTEDSNRPLNNHTES
jgi:GAF domain-containing protein